jgi:hypothetical protein
VRRGQRYAALALVVVLGASGCGAASPDSPPSGIDELVIPTPSPDPTDFVRSVDNPWLSYADGKVWSYRVRAGGVDYLQSVTVLPDRRDVAGVATTVVETLLVPALDGQPHGTPIRTRDFYAQDRQGNVWWFGREGEWQAGQDGVEAGLAMPATPRLGDGWRAAYGAGVVDVRATVATTDQTVSTPAGEFTHLVGIDLTSPLDGTSSRRVFYERGLGMVEDVSTDGPVFLAELESPPG